MRVCVLGLLLGVFAIPAQAQDPTPQETPPTAQPQNADPLAALRGKATLTDEERGVLKNWLTDKINAIVAGTGSAASAIREEHAKGSEGFKQALAATTVELVEPAYKSAKLAPAAQLMALVASFGDPAAQKLLLQALADERVGIRTAAAIGLANLRTKLGSAGGQPLTESIEALREAAKKETSGAALKTIYYALNFPAAGATVDAKSLSAAVVDILAARAEQYAGDKPKAEAADAPGLELAGTLQKDLSDADKNRLIVAAATMMHYGVQHYTASLMKINNNAGSALVQLRNDTEALIEQAEARLLSLMSPQDKPNITDAMKKAGDAAAMKTQLNKWADLLKGPTGKDFSATE